MFLMSRHIATYNIINVLFMIIIILVPSTLCTTLIIARAMSTPSSLYQSLYQYTRRAVCSEVQIPF